MKVLAIIPAREGSKRLPGKNIKLLCGKPLIHYSIESAQKSKLVDKIILTTDSKKIAKISGLNIPFLRPKRLSNDESLSIEFVIHALKALKKLGYIPDIIVLLQPTQPCRPDNIIDDSIKLLIKSKANSVISVDEKTPNFANGLIYTFWRETVEKSFSFYGVKTERLFINCPVDIDTIEDWNKAVSCLS